MAGAPVSCGNDPNFGIILSFMEQFGPVLDIGELNIAELQSMLENSETVPQALADLHIKLMRKINKKVPAARWELALAKFAHSYSHQDAWEIERFGYKTANLAVKLRVLKALLEGQFDLNTKFKTQINTTGAGELRLDPLGRDRQGNCYWYFMDESANVQIYQSDPEMEAWTLVARNRDEFVNMIEMLKDNRPIEPIPAGNAADEEDESAGSASDAEAMKLGTILAPSETPPSLIISRRTYKTCDKVNAPAAAEDEANAGEDSERSNSAAVEDDDVEMKTIAPPVASEREGDEKENDISVEKGNEADQGTKAIKPEDTTTDAAPAACEVKTDDGVKEAMQCELDSKDEEMSTKGEPTEGELAEESTAIDKCIKKEEPVTEMEATKSEAAAKEKEESHEEAEAERVEKSGGEKETEEQRDGKEPEANGTAQPDPEKPVEVPQASPEESLPVVTGEKKEQEIVDKPDTEPAAETAVGEAIEDPPVVVRGAGSGAECDSGIVPMFSEVIEEPIMFFYGAGAGVENGMGNTKKVEPALTAPESTTVNETKPVGTKEREPSTDNAPVTSKAGNGERKPSPKGKPVKDGSASRSASKGPLVHSDGEEHAKSECNEKKPLEETGCTDNGGADHADPPSKGGELSAKDNDTMELGDRAVDDGCDEGNVDHEAAEVEPSQKKRTRKPPSEKPQKVTVAPRGKRSEKSPVETALPAVAELVQEKPMEKKRGSRKSSTPKKAVDSITATAILMQDSQEVKSEGQLKIESEEKPQPSAGVEPAEDIKLSSVEQEPNGDHLQQPESSCAEGNSNGVKKEERKEVIVKEEGIADCKKESKSDLSKLTEVAVPGEVKQGSEMVAAASKDITEETTDAAAAARTPIKEEKKEELEKSLDGGASDKGGVPQSEGESPAKRKRRQRNGLVDGLDISMVLDAGSDGGNNPPVRQSRRIAMQKIKEETNRRQIEDEMLKKMKADAVKKKKDLGMHISDDEYRRTESTPDQSDSSSSGGGMGGDGRRRKKKKKKKKGSYQQQLLQQQQLAAQLLKKQTTWNSATSPESSSETEAEDYFAEPYHSEEDVRRSNVLKSDHEFSPESDLESEAPAQPLKRARTARKARRTRDVEAEEEEEEDEEESDGGEDHACQECKKTDQPEWILLCDSCDKGYHCACLKPVLFTIPEGDWFCPVCQHRQLIERLQSKLELYDALQAKLVAEAKRREEEEQCAREAELAEQALEREREEQLRAQKRARQQQRLLERADSGRGRGGAGGNGRRSSRSRSASLDSSREEHQRQRRRRKQRQRNRRASKRRRSSRSRSGDGSGSGASGGSDDGSGGSGSGGSGTGGSGSCTDSDDIPIYKHLRRRASTKVSYKFNEYDNLIDSAIRREMRGCEMMEVEPDEEDVDDEEGHGFSKGKDISTIIEATTREEQARKKAAAATAASADLDANEEGGGLDKDAIAEHDVDRRLNGSSQDRGENDGDDAVASPTGEEGKKSGGVRQDRAKATTASKKARKKKKKLCKIELSSEEEEDDSDEDFRGDVSGSDDEEEEDDDEEDEDENSMSGDSESSLEVGRRGRNAERSRKPSSRAAVSKRRRIVENSDDSEDEAEERRREIAKKNRKNRRVLDDSDEDLDLDDDDDEEDSEDYDSDDLCSDTETESSRSSDNSSNSSSSSSSSASTEGDWRRKKKKKTKGTGGGGKTKSKSAPSGGGGGGLGSGKHIERPPKKPSTATGRPKAMDSSGEDSGDSDSAGKGGKTMPRKPSKKSASRSSRSPESGKGGEKKSDRKTRGKKIHYIVDDDFESSDDGIRPGVQRPDTPPEEREQFIRRQEEIKRMLAENNAAKAKELATSKIDQLVGGGRAGVGSAKESAKDSLSDVPMQVIESARILDIDFLKSTSGNTARISTVDSVVDFDDELPEDFDPDDEMDDEALAKIMEEEDFAHHQLKTPVGVTASITSAADLLPPVPGPPPMKANRRKSIPDPGELLLPQQRAGRPTTDPPAASQTRKDLQHHHASPLPVNLASSVSSLPPPHVQSPMKALLKPTGIPTSTIMPPMVSAGGGGGGTILANALQTTAAPHGHHAPMVPPPPLVKELPHPGASRADVLMRSLAGPPPPGGSLHHKPSDLSHLMAGLAGSGIALPLAKGGGAPLSLPPPPHTHHSSHRMPPVGLGMPPNMLGHGPPPHAPHLGVHTKLPPGVPPGVGHGSNVPHSAAAVAAAVAAASAAAAAAIGAGGASGPASAGQVPSSGIPHTTPTTGNPSTPTLAVGTSPHPVVAASAAERRPGRRKKITPLREDLKRRGNAAAGPPPPSGEQQPSAVPSAAHQEQHQRLPPQHASQHHGHMVRLPAGPPPPPTSTAAPPVGLRPPIPPATSIHNTAHQNATAMAAAAAAAAAAQELAIKVHSRSGDGGGAGVGGPGMLVNEPPLSVPSSVAHLSYLSENPLFAHRLGPLPSSILSSGSSSLQRIAAISGAAGPPTVYGDPTAYNGGWKPPPPGSSSKMKSTGSTQPPPPPTHSAGMMVGPPSIGSLEHYHEYNPANHYNPYYNVLDRAHLRPPPTIGELHRTSALSPTTFTTLQPLEFQHVMKPTGDNHHHHHSATSSPASTAGEDVGGGGSGGGGGRGSASSVERLAVPSHGGGPPPSSSAPASSETHPSVVEAASPPPSASVAVSVAPSTLVPPSAVSAVASTTASTTSSSSTSVFGELVSYFSSQQDDLDS